MIPTAIEAGTRVDHPAAAPVRVAPRAAHPAAPVEARLVVHLAAPAAEALAVPRAEALGVHPAADRRAAEAPAAAVSVTDLLNHMFSVGAQAVYCRAPFLFIF